MTKNEARRLTRPGVLVVEFEGCRRLLVIESNNEGLRLARTGKRSEANEVRYESLVHALTGQTLKEFLR